MIKKVLLFSLLILTIQFSFGQDVFRIGKTGIDIGGGFRTIGNAAYGGNLRFERSVSKIGRIGYLGLGLNGDLLIPIEGDMIGEMIPSATFRAAYHAGFFRTKVLDIYSGVGLAIAKRETPAAHLFHPDIFLGFRSKFSRSRKAGFFAELSYFGANYKAGIFFIL